VGLLDASEASPLPAQGGLALDQAGQEVHVGPLLPGRQARQFLDVLLHERQVQVAQLLVQLIRRCFVIGVGAHAVLRG
jgi:hypothetical protein